MTKKSKPEKPFVNNKYLLEKYPGKGGWTYAAVPDFVHDRKSPFGWIKVKGKIDSCEIKNYSLMPLGNGKLFLPVKADIRKKTGKKVGDWVTVVLYEDNSPLEIPEELLICLKDTPALLDTFMKYPDSEKKAFINWIYAAKQDKTKVDRITKTLSLLEKGRKLNDKNK